MVTFYNLILIFLVLKQALAVLSRLVSSDPPASAPLLVDCKYESQHLARESSFFIVPINFNALGFYNKKDSFTVCFCFI